MKDNCQVITGFDYNKVKERVKKGVDDALESLEPYEIIKSTYDIWDKVDKKSFMGQTQALYKNKLLEVVEEQIVMALRDCDIGIFVKNYR